MPDSTSSDSAAVDTNKTYHRFPCAQCGARLEYTPGTDRLACPYCGHQNQIALAVSPPDELDYATAIAALRDAHQLEDPAIAAHARTVDVLNCQTCAAKLEKPPDLTAFSCPYCGSNVVASAVCEKLIKPNGVLPFAVSRDKAVASFRAWIASRWFAPNALKRQAALDSGLAGLYLPYWTYDCRTTTWYTGERGEHYYVTVRTGNGTTRQRRTRWYPASGVVANTFDDVLVLASRSLPGDHASRLEPWDLQHVVRFDEQFLPGFVAESYQLSLPEGFVVAQKLMVPTIEASIRADIGGDDQRISDHRSKYNDITFKHLLLPVWISSYRYLNKVYHFYVNARTGEVSGERPYSFWKIFFLVVAILIVVGIAAAIIVAYNR